VWFCLHLNYRRRVMTKGGDGWLLAARIQNVNQNRFGKNRAKKV
jgi:hypothetical protein